MAITSLHFLGAVGTVTGSRFLIEQGDHLVLVDAGLYQGQKELRLRNWQAPTFEVSQLDAVVLTHAHLDHCGYLPALYRAGFRGPIYATPGTIALANIVLPDAGRLQEEEAFHANKYGWSRHNPAVALFNEEEAIAVGALFQPVAFGNDHHISGTLSTRFDTAGHILGAASVTMTTDAGRRVVFSGDLGRSNHPLLLPPAPRPDCDVLLIESTYGDRNHKDMGLDSLASAICRTVERKGTIIIPAFAVDRTELVIHAIQQLERSGAIPIVPVIVDSPMALAALKVYRAARDRRDCELRPEVFGEEDPFTTARLSEAATVEDSKAATARGDSTIVISASGMATGGRVLHHLTKRLPDPRSCVIIAGFQSRGTRGSQLAEGATEVKIHGAYVPVRAEVVAIDAFSGHADSDDLMAWADTSREAPQTSFVIHGEPEASTALRTRLRGASWTAVIPKFGERVVV